MAITARNPRCGNIALRDVRTFHVETMLEDIGGEFDTAKTTNELKMIEILPEPASTIVALFAFAGLRKAEVRGGRWEAYTGV